MITFCPSSVRRSVYIFKRLLLWNRWASFAQILYGASLGQENEGLLKWSRSVDQDAHICLKPLKIFLSRTEDALGLNLAQIIGDRRSTKVVKIMVVHWRLTFLRRGQVYFPMYLYIHLYGKRWEFQTTSPLTPLCQCCSNFMWSLLGTGEWRVAKMVAVHWPRWPPGPYIVKTLKIFFSRTEDALGPNLFTNYQGQEIYKSC